MWCTDIYAEAGRDTHTCTIKSLKMRLNFFFLKRVNWSWGCGSVLQSLPFMCTVWVDTISAEIEQARWEQSQEDLFGV